MTRLISQDVRNISVELDRFDSALQEKTGHALLEIACHAAGMNNIPGRALISSLKAGVVPMTCGQGIIEGFSGAVKSILTHLGFNAFITQHTDATGVAEAFEDCVDILMTADDSRFVALVPKNGQVIDNAVATGKGFATGLDFMAGGLQGKRVLIIGCGPVGQSAAEALVRLGARVSVYDINRKKCMHLAKQILRSQDVNIITEKSLESALNDHRFVVEATNSPNVIDEKYLGPETCIAAPGIPLGTNAEVYKKMETHILHDPLQTGVATMGLMALKVCRSLEMDEEVESHEQ